MKKVIFDYSKLKGRIKEKNSTQEEFSEKIGMSRSTLSQKLKNIREFTQYEIQKTCETLDIPKEEIALYFFVENVKQVEQSEKQ